MTGSGLEVFFQPRSVAVIGAAERESSVGRAIFENLSARHPAWSTPAKVFAVNPKHRAILGVPCFPNVAAIGEPTDLAVIVIPAPCVPDAVHDCAVAGVRGAIVISAGFRETGPRGAELEQKIVRIARESGMRVVGPNCVGVMNPHAGLNATFAASMARPGHIGLISQSGAICTSILDWSQEQKVGFSSFVSTGSMADVEWGDLLEHFGRDPNTRSIIAYMESVPNAARFVEAARNVARIKPVIVLKPGRTAGAAKAAASHTGALTGRDDVLDAAFARCGVLRVDTIEELFDMAETLDRQPAPLGPRLMMITNAGGAGVLAADALLEAGGELAPLSPETVEKLNAVLPAHWSHNNPIDILGDADPARYRRALEIAATDASADGLLVTLAPQAMTDPLGVARELERWAHGPAAATLATKPLLTSWMGGTAIHAAEDLLNNAGIPTFRYPDAAARVFQAMWRYNANLAALQVCDPEDRFESTTHPAILAARGRGRALLTEAESKRLLADYGIPTVPTEIAQTCDEAVSAAEKLGFPVAVKLHSETITHKTDVGGVRLNLADADGVRAAFQAIQQAVPAADFLGVTVQPMVRARGFELIIGASIDPQFGPVLLFGAGGTLVEVYKDRCVDFPPLSRQFARRMIERTRIAQALQGVRGQPPVDLDVLCEVLMRFARLILEQPAIAEFDMNPLLAAPEGVMALDARGILKAGGAEVVPPAFGNCR